VGFQFRRNILCSKQAKKIWKKIAILHTFTLWKTSIREDQIYKLFRGLWEY
ncbi:hypothetical protein MKX03_005808, partial [Papaver bracteatum]